MAAYSSIATSELAVNKPVTSSLMTRLRDNPIAIFEQLNFSTSSSTYVSTGQATTAGNSFTLNHGLSGFTLSDAIVQVYLQCVTGANGYTTGDLIPYNPQGRGSTVNSGLALAITSTQIKGKVGSSGTIIVDLSTGTTTNVSASGNFQFIISIRA